jgi:hypothetical protein
MSLRSIPPANRLRSADPTQMRTRRVQQSVDEVRTVNVIEHTLHRQALRCSACGGGAIVDTRMVGSDYEVYCLTCERWQPNEV